MRQFALWSAVALLAGCAGETKFSLDNTEPGVVILQPADRPATFAYGEAVTFVGQVTDDRTPNSDLTVTWSSSIDGPFANADNTPDQDGVVEFVTASLTSAPVNPHIITLIASDSDGGQGQATVEVFIEEGSEEPWIKPQNPKEDGDKAPQNQSYIFQAIVGDNIDSPDKLVGDVSVQPGGKMCDLIIDGTGNADCPGIFQNLGQHIVTFTVRDTENNEATARRTIDVVDPADFDADGDGYSPNAGDCNDGNENMYPGAPEICDGLDNDCNSATGIDVGTDCWDDDGDGYCENPPCANASGSVPDCDDTNAAAYPGVGTELPNVNGVDDDCDGDIDEGTVVWDDDGDGYCETPPCNNTNRTKADCDDTDPDVNPGMDEVCSDGKDNDCDGKQNAQDAVGCTDFYLDNDGDTYGVGTTRQCWCDTGKAPYTGLNNNDCDDNAAAVNPGQTGWFSTAANGSFDYNCDGSQTRRYTGTTSGCQASATSCDVSSPGWEGGNTPACGQAGNYLNGCDEDWWAFAFSCGPCALACAISINSTCINCLTSNCPNGMSCTDYEYLASVQECH